MESFDVSRNSFDVAEFTAQCDELESQITECQRKLGTYESELFHILFCRLVAQLPEEWHLCASEACSRPRATLREISYAIYDDLIRCESDYTRTVAMHRLTTVLIAMKGAEGHQIAIGGNA